MKLIPIHIIYLNKSVASDLSQSCSAEQQRKQI